MAYFVPKFTYLKVMFVSALTKEERREIERIAGVKEKRGSWIVPHHAVEEFSILIEALGLSLIHI